MPWDLVITRPAKKDLTALSATVREAIERALARLTDDPDSVDVRKLAGRENEWRLRVGDWRVLLRFDNATGTMYVLRVRPRGSAYRD